MLSIQLSVTSGQYINEVLESFRTQTSQDFEVIVVNSNKNYSDAIKDYGAKEIFIATGKLEARFLAHKEVRGEYELLLEETRLLRSDAVAKLEAVKGVDMAIINELELGSKFINKLNRIDSEMSFRTSISTPENLHILPRYFRKEVLDFSFSRAREKLSRENFSKVISSDQEILYYEAYKRYSNMEKVDDQIILKYGEKTISESMKKYYRYGQTQRLLARTPYGEFYNFSRRRREIPSVKSFPAVACIYLIRGTAFFLGYFL